MKSGRS
jgi:hypothetical protein